MMLVKKDLSCSNIISSYLLNTVADALDFQTLLNTQTALLSAEDNFIQAQNAVLSSSVGFYKAMGGGWL
ncbi:MAG: hypothetical protein OQK49_09450 [Proteobacteria bacterium]|nr:hypothetical protein [Pseudomonadota bacterium]